MPPWSLPLLTYSSFNQLPCSSPAVLCSFCCSSQWIFDAVKCVTGWETLAPPHALSLCHFQSLHPSSFVSQSLSLILQLSQLQCSDLSSLFLTWFTPPPLYLPALLPSFPITPLSLTNPLSLTFIGQRRTPSSFHSSRNICVLATATFSVFCLFISRRHQNLQCPNPESHWLQHDGNFVNHGTL